MTGPVASVCELGLGLGRVGLRSPRPVAWFLLATGVQSICSVQGQNPDPIGEGERLQGISAARQSHERMVAELDRIRVLSASENPYVGELYGNRDRDLLATLPAGASASQRSRLQLAVGKDALRLGRTDEALTHFLEGYRLSEPGMVRPALQLGIAYLRLAETQNCLHHPNPDRCILPLRDGGVHTDPTAARKAARYFREVLRKQPGHVTARWLLNLAHMQAGDYPREPAPPIRLPPEALESESPFPRFRDIAAGLGLSVRSLSGGAVAEDFDGDGWLDLAVSDWDPSAELRYFRNEADGTFSERTAEAGLEGIYGGLNLVHGDYDNDGDADLYVLRGAWLGKAGRHPNSLLQNDGNGRFTDITYAAGLGTSPSATQTAAWGDYDNDGDLDLYVGNENSPSQLYKNLGSGTFEDVAVQAGVTNGAMAKAVVWGDVDSDRFLDLYVSNFGAPNLLYRNNRDGTFTDIARDADVTFPHRSFPSWFWDFDNDGNLDLFVASYERDVRDVAAGYFDMPPERTEPDSLYRGNGNGGFEDVASAMNLVRVTQPMGANFGDLDNDGYPDFYLGTGYPEYEGLMPNLLFHNQGGTRFSDVTANAGLGHLQKGHGVAFADFDHDGDQDIFIEMGGAYAGDVFDNALFENPGFGNGWIAVTLVGVESNRSAIGARIRADIREASGRRSIYRWVNAGGSFGANPLRQHVGLGTAGSIDVLEIYWPSTDTTQRFEDIASGQFIEVKEGQPGFRTIPHAPVRFGPMGGK